MEKQDVNGLVVEGCLTEQSWKPHSRHEPFAQPPGETPDHPGEMSFSILVCDISGLQAEIRESCLGPILSPRASYRVRHFNSLLTLSASSLNLG